MSTAIKLQAQHQTISPMKLIGQDKTQSTHCEAVALLSNTSAVTLDKLVRDDNVLTVSQMKSQGRLTDVIMMVQLMLCEYLDNVNLRSSMNEHQIELAAKLMVEEHQHLPTQSFPLFFKDCLCKRFGDHYGRMDIPTLMGWLKIFHDNYDEMVDEQSFQSHQSTKGDKTNLMALIEAHKGEELVPMPDSVARAAGLRVVNPDADRIAEIRLNVIKANQHLYTTLGGEEAMKQINALIDEELLSNGIFV